jgi:hypothetical protein
MHSAFNDEERVRIANVCSDIIEYDDLPEYLRDKIYDHFVNNGDMPIGIAKARTGDPDEWICDHLHWLM